MVILLRIVRRISWQSPIAMLSLAALLAVAGCSGVARRQQSTRIPVGDFVLPVRGITPANLTPNFGTPRGNGKRLHEGLDITAPKGREVLACVAGTVDAKKWSRLGGNSIWLHGDDGRYYYYAHLSAYAVGVDADDKVRAADVIGFVGNTGDAQGQAPHLHFEIHDRRGGPAYDPYPILCGGTVAVVP